MKFTNILITSLLATGLGFSQAKSDVVGYLSLGSSTGDAIPPNTEITVSIPFVKNASDTVTVASASSNTITINETITANAYAIPSSGASFMIEVVSGANEGVYMEISSNSSNVITLNGTGTGTISDLSPGDQIVIREAWTISTVFGNTLPDNTFISTFDNTGINASAATQYTIFGGQWFNSTTGSVSDDVVLYPGESFLYRNNSSVSVPSLIIDGVVPTTKSRIVLLKDDAGQQETRFGYVGPVGEKLGESGFTASASDNDIISFFDNDATGVNKSASAQYIFFGGQWFSSTTGNSADDVELKPGQGYLYRRIDSNTTDTVVTDAQSYIENL